MMILTSLDLETTGLPNGRALDDAAYPRMIQIGGVKFTSDGRVFGRIQDRVRQEDVRTSRGAEKVHGISDRASGATGLPEKVALAWITNSLRVSTHVVGWSLQFDLDVIRAALIRLGHNPDELIRPRLQQVDLMELCTPIVGKQDAEGRQVWPKLDEAYRHLFGEEPEGRHDALGDADACRRIFLRLLEMGRIPDMERSAA